MYSEPNSETIKSRLFMQKVLFLIQTYPAKRSANVICDTKIINELKCVGNWEIHILCYRFPWQLNEELLDGVYIHRFNRSWWWNILMKSLEKPLSKKSQIIQKLDRIRMRIAQILFCFIYPNYEPLLYTKFRKEAVKLCCENDFDLVVAEHYGGDTLSAGAKVKVKFPQIKLVSILWDPISGRTLPKYLPHSYAEKKNLVFEGETLRCSDLIIGMKSHENYQIAHSQDKPFFKKVKFLDIPGVIIPDQAGGNESYTVKGRINVIYTGVLNLPDRDPSLLLKILSRSKFANKFNLMFFSVGGGAFVAKKLLDEYHLFGFVHPFIPRPELNAVFHASTFLLNIGGPNSTQVPSKIFEYMSYGKPIVSTYYVDDETSKNYFSQYPLALCIDLRKDIDDNVCKLDGFLKSKIGSSVNFNMVEELFPLNSPKVFVSEFQKLIK